MKCTNLQNNLCKTNDLQNWTDKKELHRQKNCKDQRIIQTKELHKELNKQMNNINKWITPNKKTQNNERDQN